MAIELSRFGAIGVVIFFIALFLFECFFGVIGSIIASLLGLNGMFWWIFVIGIVLIGNALFVNIN